MKAIHYFSVIALVALAGCNQEDKTVSQKSDAVELQSQTQKISYVLGMNTGHQLKSMSLEVDKNAFSAGIGDAIEESEPRLSEDDIKAALEVFQKEMTAKREAAEKEARAAFEVESEGNKKEGEAFLAENGKKDGVTTTESGLQYKVLVTGNGPKPSETNTVRVNYKGRLIDGTEFDSSFKRGVPAEFGVNQVIAGWTEALKLMPEGSKWELYIPPDLAYGPGGTGPIGPNQTLIFEVELLNADVQPEEKKSEDG